MASWRTTAAAALVAAGFAHLPAAAVVEDSLTLRVNDARAEPGALVAVVVRTYATRGLVQGEICLTASGPTKSASLGTRARRVIGSGKTVDKNGGELSVKTGSMPFAALEAVDVDSAAGDSTIQAAFDATRQTALVRFASASGTVNESDGPLAVFYFRLSGDFAGPAEFEIGLDLGGTFLIDADGEAVAIEPLPGRLEVRPPGEILRVKAVGDRTKAGDVAVLGVGAESGFASIGGQVAVSYDPAFAAGPVEVRMEPLDGKVSFAVDATVAGRVLVSFDSAGNGLDFGPGNFVTIHLPTSQDLADGDRSPIVFDAASTFLVDSAGRWIGLELRDGELEID